MTALPGADQQVACVADERISLRRKAKQVGVALLVSLAALGLCHTFLRGRLLLNITPSIPRGVYWISGVSPQRGDLVTFPIPDSVRALVYERQYVPREIELLSKPVVAIGGDEVCIRDHRLIVNGDFVANVLDLDRKGRPMPRYSGCATLGGDDLFVATHHDRSFDSRNFGPIPRAALRGTLTPLLTSSLGERRAAVRRHSDALKAAIAASSELSGRLQQSSCMVAAINPLGEGVHVSELGGVPVPGDSSIDTQLGWQSGCMHQSGSNLAA